MSTIHTVRRKASGGAVDTAAQVKQLETFQAEIKKMIKEMGQKPAFAAASNKDGSGKYSGMAYTVSLECPVGFGPASTQNVVEAIGAGRLHLPTHTPSLFKFERSYDETGAEKNRVVFCLPPAAGDAAAPRIDPVQAADALTELSRAYARKQLAEGPGAKLDLDFSCTKNTEEDDCGSGCVWEMNHCIPQKYSQEGMLNMLKSTSKTTTASASASASPAAPAPAAPAAPAPAPSA